MLQLTSLYNLIFVGNNIPNNAASILQDHNININDPYFLAFLKHIHAESLEQSLFETPRDVVSLLPDQLMPSDSDMLVEFHRLNQYYGYLPSNAVVENHFIIFFKLSKFVADYVEHNNTAENTKAYLHAYQLLVLFGVGPEGNVFSYVDDFFQTHGDKLSLAYLLSKPLPVKSYSFSEQNLLSWQHQIRISGVPLLSLFQRAPEMNKFLLQLKQSTRNLLFTGAHAQANCDALITHENLSYIVDALTLLSAANLLTEAFAQANFDALIRHRKPFYAAQAITRLSTTTLFSQDAQANYNTIIQSQEPKVVAEILILLLPTGLLTGTYALLNRNRLVKHGQVSHVEQTLQLMIQNNLLTRENEQANFTTLITYSNPSDIEQALTLLSNANLLSELAAQSRFDMVLKHSEPSKVAEILSLLSKADVLDDDGQGYLNAARHQDANDVLCTIKQLLKAKLLTKSNYYAVIAHSSLSSVHYGLSMLEDANLITEDGQGQGLLDALLATDSPGILARQLKTNAIKYPAIETSVTTSGAGFFVLPVSSQPALQLQELSPPKTPSKRCCCILL